MRLRTRIIVAVVIACGIINLVMCFYFTRKIKDFELENLNAGIEKSSYMMRLVSARPLYNVDKESLLVNMKTFFDDENIKSISLQEHDFDIDIKLEREFAYSPGIDIKKSFFIYFKGQKLGEMNVVYSTGLIEQKLARFRNRMLLFTFIIMAFLVVVLILLVNKLLQPVTELTLAASDIASGNLDREIEQGGVGEVGELSRNFAVMRDAIKEKINDLAMTNRNLEKEISIKEINEKKILRQSTVIASVNDFFQKSTPAETYEEVARIFIPIALQVIPSKYCFIGEVTKDNKNKMDILAMSEQASKDCNLIRMDNTVRYRPKEVKGIRSCLLHQDEPIILNDPQVCSDFFQFPENHIPIHSFLGIHMKMGPEIKGIVAFAGKDGGYDMDDRKAGEILAIALEEALNLKKKENEKARLEKMMIQSEKMISIGGLAAGMAHEINNPLAGVLQNAQVIQNRLHNKLKKNESAARALGLEFNDIQAYMEKREIYKMLDSILDAGRRAAAIVSNMLSFCRKSRSGFTAEDVCELLDKTLELAESDYDLKKKFDFKKIKIIKSYETGIPKILCKASEMQQVFFNVLSNGAQAMESWKNLKYPCFMLRVSRQGNMVSIEIKDNGPGMQEEIKKRIFDPFFTTKRVGEGTGLGLAVSYFILTENHKGSVSVVSQPFKGANFIIKLPCDRQTIC